MTASELLDLLIAELDQLRADNRRLNLELAAARSQRDSCSSASPLVGVTGRPELWWGACFAERDHASVLVAHNATDSTKCRAARRRPQLGRR
jgi:hypothetical protein